jgi:putative ABC transport system permease protein
MRTVFLASLRTHSRRYVAAAVAVIVSVAFVVVIGVLTAGSRAGLMDGFGAPFRGADHVVSRLSTNAMIDLVQRHGENASAIGRVTVPMSTGDRPSTESTLGPVAASAALRWQELVSGRFPARDGEAVVHIWNAQSWSVAIGDHLQVGEGATAVDLTVVGLVESPSATAQASIYVTWSQFLHWRDHPSFHLGKLSVRGDVGPLPASALVQDSEEFVTQGLAGLSNDVDAWTLQLSVFAAVALFVSVLVISNTFSILFAQRLRDFALLRCVGATRRQVLGSVRREAAAVGLLSSLTGALVGLGLGYGLVALINTVAPTTPMGTPALPVIWLVGGLAAGLVITVVASWWPTRHVVRLRPLAALRPQAAVDVHSATGRTRLAIAALLLVAGLALLTVAMTRDDTTFMLAGGAAVFIGVLLLGPALIPRLIRVAGALLGPSARLATENAVRNPRRTATTTAALLVGVTLTTAVLTGMATTRIGLDEQRGRQRPIDVALTTVDQAITTEFLDQVRRTPGVERAVPATGVVAEVAGLDAPIPIVTAPDAAQVARDGGAFARVPPGQIRLDYAAFRQSLGARPGDRITVRVGDRQAELTVAPGTGWGRTGVVSPETLATLTADHRAQTIWIRAADDADPIRLLDSLGELAGTVGAQVTDQLQARQSAERQWNILTWSMLGLIGIAIVIALVGIANTLGLSVLERAREHALLRALGLTRGQLRRLLATEALLLAMVATVLGTVIGVGFAWVGYETVVTKALAHATMQIPWAGLAAVVLGATLAGLLAAVLPARRAAAVTPAVGLTMD